MLPLSTHNICFINTAILTKVMLWYSLEMYHSDAFNELQSTQNIYFLLRNEEQADLGVCCSIKPYLG